MSQAQDIMRRFNPNALVGSEGDIDVMIEDFSDPDGRIYRMEYQCTPDGRHAVAFCRYNPWGGVNGDESAVVGHVWPDGSLCMGSRHMGHGPVSDSPYPLDKVVQRGRYWCTAFSVLKETGRFPQP